MVEPQHNYEGYHALYFVNVNFCYVNHKFSYLVSLKITLEVEIYKIQLNLIKTLAVGFLDYNLKNPNIIMKATMLYTL